MRRIVELFKLVAILSILLTTGLSRCGAQDLAVIQKGKAAVALIEAGPNKVASAFCIDPLGIFVTNHHVVEDLGIGASVKLIMQSSESEEWVLTAEVVSLNKTNDLAILKAYSIPNDKKLTALELARTPNLYETMDLVAFGFPFGKQLTVKKGSNPSISVNVGKLTAIRKENGLVELIQLDASLNPGNSGGPVVDQTGKVVGIVSFGMLASGVNFAIPVEKLWPMIKTPYCTIDASGLLLDPYVPSTVRLGLISMQADIPDLTAEIWCWCLGSDDKKVVPLKTLENNQFEGVVSVASDDPKKISLRGRFVLSQGEVSGTTLNEPMKLKGKQVWLSSIASIRQAENGKTSSILLQDGNSTTVETAELGQVNVNYGEVSATIPLSKVKFAQFERGKQEPYQFNFVIKSKDQVIMQEVIDENKLLAFKVFGQTDATSESESNSDGSIHSLDVDLATANVPKRAKYSGTEKVIPLPNTMKDVCRAAAGRFLLVSMGNLPSLAIIDLDQAQIVKILPLPSQEALVAGTNEHFFVWDPIKNNLNRYSLQSLEIDASAPVPFEGKPLSFCAGEASDGPLAIIVSIQKDNLNFNDWVFVDPIKLKSIPYEINGESRADKIKTINQGGSGPRLRASADGKVFGAWGFAGSPTGVLVASFADRFLTPRYEHTSMGHVVPTSDGMHLLTESGGVLNQSLSGIEPFSGRQAVLFPSSHPIIYLSLLGRRAGEDQTQSQSTKGIVRMIGAEASLASLPPTGLEPPDASGRYSGPNLDKRLYLDVEAGILVSIPFSDDKVLVQPFDLHAELKKTATDYLVATAPKKTMFEPGGIYQNKIQVETNRPNIGYRLLSGPKGMEISPTGVLVWKVPGLYQPNIVDVILSITSDGNHQTYVAFKLKSIRGR
ncbi:MAG: S1C family serine protease [Planctomycetota bacterium]